MKYAIGTSLFALLLISAACASGGAPSGAIRQDRNLITHEQIREANKTNVYQLVQALHPRWLRKRGQQSFENEGDVVVYYENARLGGPRTLRQISAAAVTSVRYFDAPAANFRWGTGHSHGAILVSADPVS